MPFSETDVTKIAEWLDFRKGTKSKDRQIVFFLGSRMGIFFKNTNFYSQIQTRSVRTFDALDEKEKFYECYRVLSRLEPMDRYTILTTSLMERPKNVLQYQYLARLVKEDYVDAIITTNIDTSLEEALRREEVQESRDYHLLAYGGHPASEIIHLPDSGCILLKIFGDLRQREYRTAGNEFDLREDKNLRRQLEHLLAQDILVIGYDREWDFPLEWAFPSTGKDFMFMNEDPPMAELLLTRALKRRNGMYLAEKDKLTDLIGEIYFELREKGEKKPTSQLGEVPRTKIFISYCHHDTNYMQRLKVFLRDYTIRHQIDVWDDTKIPTGSPWYDEMMQAIRQTKIAIVLLSADYFASDFINQYELPLLLEGAEAGKITLILVIISYCDFRNRPQLAQYQAVNPPSNPLETMDEGEQNKIWERVKRLVMNT
jgi:TIR domain/SIR2-like domain